MGINKYYFNLTYCKFTNAKLKSQTFLGTHVKLAHPNPILMNVELKKESENALNTEHNLGAQNVVSLNSSPQNKNDEKSRSNSCDTCGVAMWTVEALNNHLKNHIKVECDQKFTSEMFTANVSNIEILKTLKCD